MAALLGVQLGGTNYYAGVASHRATLGQALELLRPAHVERAIAHMHGAWAMFLGASAALLLLMAVVR